MSRDNFKCVLCGDNPPASPELILHIDHIMPWSKGGKTQIDNLRTLCANCNIGRGNRYFIAQDNPDAAMRVIEAAYEAFKTLAANPGLGRPRRFRSPRLRDVPKFAPWITCW
jgi:hypothetical protein